MEAGLSDSIWHMVHAPMVVPSVAAIESCVNFSVAKV